MSTTYQKPTIRKIQPSFVNKHGTGDNHRYRSAIDGVAIGQLVEKFGSPLFVYSEQNLRRCARRIYDAFGTRYPNFVGAWSYKTNYLGAISAIVHQEGAMAEVVSAMEYEMARSLGIPGERIVLNGPCKPHGLLMQAATEGALVNVDHFDEITDMETVANTLGKRLPVGVRLNLDSGITPQWSRFGFNVESGQAMDAVRRICENGRLQVNGLHCHIGTFILDPTAYARQVEKMVAFSYEIQDRFGCEIEYLDIGGGFPSRSRLKGTYYSPEVGIPSIDEYAEQVCDAIRAALRPGDLPRLIVESGRAVVDEAGFLVTTVVASKYLPDGTRAYVVDSGVQQLFTSFWYKFNVEPEQRIEGTDETSVVYGSLCMNIDVLDEGTPLPPMERGQRLVLSPVGAYNNTQWMQFIHYRPNVVLIGEDGRVDLIREAEDLTDVTRRERVPSRLAPGSAGGRPVGR